MAAGTGVLTDYFRAPDAAAVARALELTGGFGEGSFASAHRRTASGIR
ncbi:hypothetical protein [Kitasatospora sp. NPDC094011]